MIKVNNLPWILLFFLLFSCSGKLSEEENFSNIAMELNYNESDTQIKDADSIESLNKSIDVESEKIKVASSELFPYYDSDNGYNIMKPEHWDARLVNDSYLEVKGDGGAIQIHPFFLTGAYAEMSVTEVSRLLLKELVRSFDDFKPKAVFSSENVVEVKASFSEQGKNKTGILVVSKQDANVIISAYYSGAEEFNSLEPLLRKILSSYKQTKSFNHKLIKNNSLENHSEAEFSMKKLAGWKVSKGGSCSTFSVISTNPEKSIEQVFLFQEVGPLYTDLSQKEIDALYGALWSDAPYIPDFNAENFLYNTKAVSEMYLVQSQIESFPRMDNIKIISSETVDELSRLYSAASPDAKLITAEFTQNGIKGKGKFLVVTVNYYYPPYGFAILFSGITSSLESFDNAEELLTESVRSIRLKTSYLQSCIEAQRQAQAAQASVQASSLDMGFDDYNNAWHERQKISDRIYNKWSDYIIGRERLYSPSTGQVYSVPNGFKDYYNTRRQQFEYSKMRELKPEEWQFNPLEGELYIR